MKKLLLGSVALTLAAFAGAADAKPWKIGISNTVQGNGCVRRWSAR